MLANDVIFQDPFNNVQSPKSFIKIFADMFEKVDNPNFKIIDYSISEMKDPPNIGYMRWIMTGEFKNKNKNILLKGMSEVHFDSKGRVLAHIDHWDSLTQLVVQLPYLGFLVRCILKYIFRYDNLSKP